MDITNIKIDRAFINSLDVTPGDRAILFQVLEESDPDKIEELAKTIISKDAQWDYAEGSDGKTDLIYQKIRCEVYKLLCTSSSKYKKERDQLGSGLQSGIGIIATALAAPLGITISISTGVFTTVLVLALKLGRNIWCDLNHGACKS